MRPHRPTRRRRNGVGLDGHGISHLWQAGIDIRVWHYLPSDLDAPPGEDLGLGYFQVVPSTWSEFPLPQASIQNVRFVVMPGDEISVQVWIGSISPFGSPDIPNGYAHMISKNLTAGLSLPPTVVPRAI